jgi:hypothetical protein
VIVEASICLSRRRSIIPILPVLERVDEHFGLFQLHEIANFISKQIREAYSQIMDLLTSEGHCVSKPDISYS